MLHTKYQSSRPCGFREEDFLKFSSWKSLFSLCDLDMQWTRTTWTILKEGHIRFIPTKFGQNPASSLGDVVWSNGWQRRTHDGRRTSIDHNSSHWANGSGELKRFNSILYLPHRWLERKICVLSLLQLTTWLAGSRCLLNNYNHWGTSPVLMNCLLFSLSNHFQLWKRIKSHRFRYVNFFNIKMRLTLTAPIMTAAEDKFCDIFSNFRQK